ncbi:MAG: M1 family metallopeptidase [Bacteroidia bacterium]|nr:M1 family metallopeptidase [Bacteroidia bacterium]HQV00117.1 M1 family metallopeptidase [Bacteroidia bacterium]
MKNIYLVLLLFANLTQAQLFDTHSLTHADTLRGMLTPVRTCFDVTYYYLNVKVDVDSQQIEGVNTINFNVLASTDSIQIDLFEHYKIKSIVHNDQFLDYTRDGNAVFVKFKKTLQQGSRQTIYFSYQGKPNIAKNPPWDGGFTFKKDSSGMPWVGVSCQGFGASCWWPCKDHQSDEPDSMTIAITCPSNLINVSNGRLRKKEANQKGYMRYEWFVANPINTYNVTLNIANYAHWHDTLDALTLDYYVLRENEVKARKQFEQVKPMLTCFEKYFGKYPWYSDGYKLVETPYLGMEHQSAVAYGNQYKNGYLGRSLSTSGIGKKFDYIIIHETAHEWWGNNITTKDIADMWVHEGFTVYAEALYCECLWGYDDYIKYINGMKFNIQNDKPVIGLYDVNTEGSGDMYNKGAMLVHTLRSIFNDDEKFLGLLKKIQKDFYHQTVTTKQIEDYFTKAYGKDLQPVFDQYLRNKSIPKLALQLQDGVVKYRWQCDVAAFNMPVKIKAADSYVWIEPTTQWQTLKGYSNVDDVKVATELFYIKVIKP